MFLVREVRDCVDETGQMPAQVEETLQLRLRKDLIGRTDALRCFKADTCRNRMEMTLCGDAPGQLRIHGSQ